MSADTAAKRYSAIHVTEPWRGVAVLPTGSVDAPKRLALAHLYSGIPALAPVTVPDVVGQTEASGTTELEGVGFVVAVTYESSETVAAGLIVSQSPAAGSEATYGSTVTIVVSTGPAPSIDPKLMGRRPNVRMKWLKEEPPPPLPAEITNMPDAPPAPPPIPRGLDFELVLPAPADPPKQAPEKPDPAPAPKPALKLVPVAAPEPAAPMATGKPVTAPAFSPAQAPTAPPAPPALTQADLDAQHDRLVSVLLDSIGAVTTQQNEALTGAVKALADQVSALRADFEADRKTRAQAERNRIRAQQIADRALRDEK